MNDLLFVDRHKEVMFELEGFFCGPTIDLENKTYFPINNSLSRKAYFTQPPNKYIDNEMRGYIRYLVVEKKLAPITIYNIVNHFTGTLYAFLIESNSSLKSILDFDLGLLMDDYEKWLKKKGINTRYEDTYINSMMEKKKKTYRFLYLPRLKEFFDYINSTYNKMNYMEMDRWYLNQLNLPFNISPSDRRKSVNFYNISPLWLKNRAKKIIYNQVPVKSIGCLNQHLTVFRAFLFFGNVFEPKHKDLTVLQW